MRDEPSMFPYAVPSAEHYKYPNYIPPYVPSGCLYIYLSVLLRTFTSYDPILSPSLDPILSLSANPIQALDNKPS